MRRDELRRLILQVDPSKLVVVCATEQAKQEVLAEAKELGVELQDVVVAGDRLHGLKTYESILDQVGWDMRF